MLHKFALRSSIRVVTHDLALFYMQAAKKKKEADSNDDDEDDDDDDDDQEEEMVGISAFCMGVFFVNVCCLLCSFKSSKVMFRLDAFHLRSLKQCPTMRIWDKSCPFERLTKFAHVTCLESIPILHLRQHETV